MRESIALSRVKSLCPQIHAPLRLGLPKVGTFCGVIMNSHEIDSTLGKNESQQGSNTPIILTDGIEIWKFGSSSRCEE